MTQLSFVQTLRASRTVFRHGALAELPAELDALGLSRLLLVCSPRTARRVRGLMGSRLRLLAEDAAMHVPVEQVDRAYEQLSQLGIDGLVAVGGGSAIGLAKALTLRTGLPLVAVPTTYSGSEMTRVWGVTADGVKRTGRDLSAAPRTVLYDPALLESLPPSAAVPSAVNALAHAVEASYAADSTPVTDILASNAVNAICGALPALAVGSASACTDALYGAWLAGICLDSTSMGLHHKLCHALGGRLGLPHAQTHTVVLPHVLAFNGPVIPQTLAALKPALGPSPAPALANLVNRCDGPTSLAALGMRSKDIDPVVDEVLAAAYANPRPAGRAELRRLLLDAHSGHAPARA